MLTFRESQKTDIFWLIILCEEAIHSFVLFFFFFNQEYEFPRVGMEIHIELVHTWTLSDTPSFQNTFLSILC